MGNHQIRDVGLAESGEVKIEWVKRNMPILNIIETEFEKTKPFSGLKITLSVHMEAKTAYLARVLAKGGAEVCATGCNPLSTQDDVAAALAQNSENITVFGWYNATTEEYEHHLKSALAFGPHIIIDDGGDLVNLLHSELKHLIPNIYGGCEETTTGVMRLRARQKEGKLCFPMISVNDAYCKYLFDNRYGTGESVWTGINRTTNLIVAGKTVVIAGYGWCGKGCAMRAKGLGANVIICEVDPIKAIEATMDGFRVMPMFAAAAIGDLFITLTGCNNIITKPHFEVMKDGAILCNAGHFDVEICLPELMAMTVEKKLARKDIMGYRTKDGRWLNVLAEGRLVNLAAGDGHPAEIMDMSFALQALSVKFVVENHQGLENEVYSVPEDIDSYVANLKLNAMNINIDRLTEEQKRYIKGYAQ